MSCRATTSSQSRPPFDSIVADFETNVGGPTKMEFTPDGTRLVLNDRSLAVLVIDTESWERVHVLSGQQRNFMPDIAVDPTGRLVATAGVDGVSIVWDLETGEEVQRFVVPDTPQGLRNVEWLDDRTLMLGTRFWASLMTIDPEELVAAARQLITRTFAPSECTTYAIDPCPTLAEVTSG